MPGPADAIDLGALKRALVVKLRHYGDTLLAAPVFGALKSAAPGLEIDALVYDDTAPMLAGHPAIAEVHVVGRRWRGFGAAARVRAERRLFFALRARRYDLIVHLTEHPRGAWLARTLGARYRVAPAVPGRGALWTRSFTHLYKQPANGRRHQVEINLDALRRIGVQPARDACRVTFVPGAAAEARVASLLEAEGLESGSFIHLHPASRWQFKCWPKAANVALIERLAAEGERIVLTAAPEREELAFVEHIVSHALKARPVSFAGRLDLKELGALAARARLFVGVDSMPMHLAGAMGTLTVALFGPSGELQWGPWGVPHRVVASRAHPCRPCGNDGCGGGKVSECLTTLPVEDVHAAVRALLEQSRAQED